MQTFLDMHRVPAGVTVQQLLEAHARDLELQGRFGVRYLKYWYDAAMGVVFCLSLAPSKEAALAVHREAHGLMPDEIFAVQELDSGTS
jgi:hypothetical protein